MIDKLQSSSKHKIFEETVSSKSADIDKVVFLYLCAFNVIV